MISGDRLHFPVPEVAGGLVAGLALGALAMRGYMKSGLHDEGFSVYAARDVESLEAVVEACSVNGLEPVREITDEHTIRALMSDGRTVFNTTREEEWRRMGSPAGAPLLRVRDPEEAAKRARDVFVGRGFEGVEIIEPSDQHTKGSMYFVSTDALHCGLLGFRRHVIRMGPRPPRWNPLKSLRYAEGK